MITPRMADAIASNLRDFGYPDVTPEHVLKELAIPPDDRSIVGIFASSMLHDHGIADDGSLLTRVSNERIEE